MNSYSEYARRISEIIDSADEDTAKNITNLVESITNKVELSQQVLNNPTDELTKRNNIKFIDGLPKTAKVACQGVEGAYSHIAAMQLFKAPLLTFLPSFDDVPKAVASGEVEFGILPIENSTAGDVEDVIELMCESGCYITAMKPIKAEHCIAAAKGSRLQDIKEVYSHPQALRQCAKYIKNLGALPVETTNTAAAAKQVAAENNNSNACLCSELSAEIYGLEILQRSVQDNNENYTRFICIHKQALVLPAATTVALALSFPNQTGALNKLLTLFSLFDLDLCKIQSMPIGGSDFNVRFHLDFKGKIGNNKVENLLGYMYKFYKDFQFLGNYPIL